MYDKSIMPLLIILSFDIILKITANTDITAIITEIAKTLVSWNVYPKKALTKAPTGNNIVNAKSKHSKTDITFLIAAPQSFPNILAYLSDNTLDKTQNANVNKKPVPPRTEIHSKTSKTPVKSAPANNSIKFIS